MPQMSPLMWLFLFVTFSTMLILSMVKLYFTSNKKITTELTNQNFKAPKINWKW